MLIIHTSINFHSIPEKMIKRFSFTLFGFFQFFKLFNIFSCSSKSLDNFSVDLIAIILQLSDHNPQENIQQFCIHKNEVNCNEFVSTSQLNEGTSKTKLKSKRDIFFVLRSNPSLTTETNLALTTRNAHFQQLSCNELVGWSETRTVWSETKLWLAWTDRKGSDTEQLGCFYCWAWMNKLINE